MDLVDRLFCLFGMLSAGLFVIYSIAAIFKWCSDVNDTLKTNSKLIDGIKELLGDMDERITSIEDKQGE